MPVAPRSIARRHFNCMCQPGNSSMTGAGTVSWQAGTRRECCFSCCCRWRPSAWCWPSSRSTSTPPRPLSPSTSPPCCNPNLSIWPTRHWAWLPASSRARLLVSLTQAPAATACTSGKLLVHRCLLGKSCIDLYTALYKGFGSQLAKSTFFWFPGQCSTSLEVGYWCCVQAHIFMSARFCKWQVTC